MVEILILSADDIFYGKLTSLLNKQGLAVSRAKDLPEVLTSLRGQTKPECLVIDYEDKGMSVTRQHLLWTRSIRNYADQYIPGLRIILASMIGREILKNQYLLTRSGGTFSSMRVDVISRDPQIIANHIVAQP